MQIKNIGPTPGRPGEGIDRLPSRADTVKGPDQETEQAGEDRGVVVQIHPTIGRLVSANDRLNALAADARTAQKNLETVSTTVGRMKDALERITKNYPPFPPGSEERVKILKGYAELRRQIDELTVPPVKDDAVAAEKTEAPASGKYTFVLHGNGMVQTIARDAVRFGPTGLVIPELQDSASDGEVTQAISHLQEAAGALAARQSQGSLQTTDGPAAEIFARKEQAVASVLGEDRKSLSTDEAAQAVSQRVKEDLVQEGTPLLHTGELRLALQVA
jgi:hypothetical protein